MREFTRLVGKVGIEMRVMGRRVASSRIVLEHPPPSRGQGSRGVVGMAA